MDLLRGDVRAIYRKYFLAAFGSALISCVYGVVDMAMVGHPQAGRCVFRLRRAGARHQRRTDFAAAGGARAGCDLVGHAGHGAAGRVLCRVGHAARDAGAAFFVSVARGLVISGALILLLPEVLGPAAIWWAMPVTERLVACYAVSAMRRATRALPSC